MSVKYEWVQDNYIKAITVQGKDGKPIAIVADGDLRGVICLFSHELHSRGEIPPINKLIYSYIYEVRTRYAEDKERKYIIIYSWAETLEEAEKKKSEIITRIQKEKFEKDVRIVTQMINSLNIPEEDKEKLIVALREGIKPQDMVTVDLVFMHREPDRIMFAVCYNGSCIYYPSNYDYIPAREDLIYMKKGTLLIDAEINISEQNLNVRVYQIDQDTYAVPLDNNSKKALKALKVLHEKVFPEIDDYEIKKLLAKKVVDILTGSQIKEGDIQKKKVKMVEYNK